MLGVLYSVFLTSRQATVNARLCQRFLDTHRKSGSVSCGVTAPFSWVQVHISSVLWKFCNQIALAFKVKFPGGSESLCQIPRLGNLLFVNPRTFATVQELLWYNCSPVCALSAWWLCGGAHTASLSDLLQQEPLSPWQAPADLYLHKR